MRTTVTLDKDVEQMLRNTMHRSRRSFKDALNSAVRASLGASPVQVRPSRFVVKARAMGLRARIDPAGFNRLVDDLEADAVMTKNRHRKQA